MEPMHMPPPEKAIPLIELVKSTPPEQIRERLKPFLGTEKWAEIEAETNQILHSRDECRRIDVNYTCPGDEGTAKAGYYAALRLGYVPRMTIVPRD